MALEMLNYEIGTVLGKACRACVDRDFFLGSLIPVITYSTYRYFQSYNQQQQSGQETLIYRGLLDYLISIYKTNHWDHRNDPKLESAEMEIKMTRS